MQRTLRDVLRERAYDVAHVQLARMTPHLDEIIDVPRVIDLVDALSLNMRRRFDRESGPMRWAAYLEWLRLRRHERSICDVVDRATVVSSIDRLAIGPYENLVVNSNGVDLRTFPFARQARDAASVVFSGNLGYFPNVGAAAWFAERVWPLVRRAVPEATFRMVGARPHRRLVRLAEGEPSISLAPDVESIHDHLARGQVAVAPMQSGSGQILKVLEAMATGDPVVSTTMGLSGIDARDGEHVLVADTPETFADRVVRLLRDPAAGDRLAQAARRLVEERYTWERSVAELEGIYAAVVRARRDRAADGTSRNCA
jgi:glycosyltransferase involved in cell wall biosynthesis